MDVEDVDAAGSSLEVGEVLSVDVAADQAIPTLNHLANNISDRTSVKDQPSHSHGNDLRRQSMYSLHRDHT
jgi:hypothetical protein